MNSNRHRGHLINENLEDSVQPQGLPLTSKFGKMKSSVLELNARAVDFLSEGMYRSAVVLLELGLRRLQDQINNKASELGTTENAFAESEPALLLRIEPQTIRGFSPIDIEEGMFSLYDKAMVMKIDNDAGADFSVVFGKENAHHVALVLLYNLSLGYQLQGIGGETEFDNLTHAVKFYLITLELLERQATTSNLLFEEGQELHPQDTVILLAALNNLGCIYANCFFDTRRARVCFVHMKAALMYCNLSDCCHFYLLTVYCKDQLLSVAPAA